MRRLQSALKNVNWLPESPSSHATRSQRRAPPCDVIGAAVIQTRHTPRISVNSIFVCRQAAIALTTAFDFPCARFQRSAAAGA
jgi:hypothetical protein